MLSYGNSQCLRLQALLFTSVILSDQQAYRLPFGNNIDLSDGSDQGDQRLFRTCFTICCEWSNCKCDCTRNASSAQRSPVWPLSQSTLNGTAGDHPHMWGNKRQQKANAWTLLTASVCSSCLPCLNEVIAIEVLFFFPSDLSNTAKETKKLCKKKKIS